MAEQYRTEQERLLWEERRATAMRILRQAIQETVGHGLAFRESNGWVLDAENGANHVQATLNRTWYNARPDIMIAVSSAHRRSGFMQARSVRNTDTDVAFGPGNAVLADEGHAALVSVAGWMAECLRNGPPEPAPRPEPGHHAGRRPRGAAPPLPARPLTA